MKIAILYATKTGTTSQAAGQLAQALLAQGFDISLCDLRNDRPDLNADAYALGGSVRMGRWHRITRAFARAHEPFLLGKPLMLFACRCGKEDLCALLAGQIGEALVSHAVAVESFGGSMDLDRQKGLDRWVVSMVQRNKDASANMETPGLLSDRILSCADAFARAVAQ